MAKADTNFRSVSRAQLEEIAHGSMYSAGTQSAQDVAMAKVELIRRDREFAEAQEQSRRAYEDQREATRREFEIKMFEAAGNRAAVQQQHAEKLAQMQANAARDAATIQAQATQQSAERQVRVARWSAYAAIAAAIAALLSLAVTVAGLWR